MKISVGDMGDKIVMVLEPETQAEGLQVGAIKVHLESFGVKLPKPDADHAPDSVFISMPV